MKKQIFILILAVFATAFAFGQGAVKYSDPRASTCVDDPLHPVAGKPYEYAASAAPTGGKWHFWATKDQNFITTTATGTTANFGTALASPTVTTSADYNDPNNTDGTVTITWSSSVLAGTDYQASPGPGTPTFVAAVYVDPAGCTNNIKVWELDPKPGFTVDVLALNPATHLPDATLYTYVPGQCADVVRTAVYQGGDQMHYDYGTNYLYYEFVAANFTNYWTPTFALTTLGATQVATYEYTFALPSTWGTTSPTWTALVSGTTKIPVDPSVVSTEDGVSVFVRVSIANNQFENLADQTLTMTLDGQDADNLWDVKNIDCTDPKAADQDDKSNQTITRRPTITPITTGLPQPDDTLIKGDEK